MRELNRPFAAIVIHVVQNCRAGELKSHWDKTNKENYHLILGSIHNLPRGWAMMILRGGGGSLFFPTMI